MEDVAQYAEALEGVRRSTKQGLAEWRYHGRLVARQLDDARVVIRADFAYRDALLQENPTTFSTPKQFAKHMMVVADVMSGERELIEEAIDAAWQLQRAA